MLPGFVRSVRLLCAMVVVSVALLALPGPVAAQGQTVSFWYCAWANGGQATVAADEPVTLRWGWGDKNKGLTVALMHNVRQVVTRDGQDVLGDVTTSGPIKSDVYPWVVYWYYEFGPLAAGDSVELYLQWSMSHPGTDGLTRDPDTGHLVHFPAGFMFDGTCTITAQ